MATLPAKLAHRHGVDVVDRERLFARLDAAAGCPLMWIDAEAGAGKTALVSSYLARRGLPALWYRVDAGDIDDATVFSHLARGVAALPRRRRLALPSLTPEYMLDLPGFRRRFFRLFFESLPSDTAVVFDALESAPGPGFQNLLLFAVAELQPRQRLFVTSREAPAVDIAHLQAKGAMTVLGSQDLRLTLDEARAVAALGGCEDEDAVRRLHRSAAGWTAGFVVLIAQLRRSGGMHEVSEGGLGEQLFPYYLNELFDRTDAQTQSLLMRTAVLPTFTASHAAALAPDADADAVLTWLLRHHFFIEHSDDSVRAYRYHELFREFLLTLGRKRLSSDERLELLLQAAGLLQTDGQTEAALALFIEARAWPAAVRLLCELAPVLLERGRSATLANLVAALPADAGGAGGWLHLWRGLTSLHQSPRKARAELELAFARFARGGERNGQLWACASILESYFFEFGDMRPIDRWGDALGELLNDRVAELPRDLEIRALAKLSILMFRGHRHAEVVEIGCQRARELLLRTDEPLQRMPLMNLIGLLSYHRGEWDAGQQFVADAGARLRADAVMPVQLVGWQVVRARLMIWRGEFEPASTVLVHAERLAAENNIATLLPLMASASIYAATNAGDLAQA